jgi:restriction system protein
MHAGRAGTAEPFFLEKGLVALGWHEFGPLSGLQGREEFKTRYAKVYPDASPQSVANCAGQLYRFVHEMQIGDMIVLPGKLSREVHIGEVTGEYAHRPEANARFPNQRSVRWLARLPRTAFSQAALYEMGSAMTLFQIRNNVDEIQALLEGGVSVAVPRDEVPVTDAEGIEEQTRDFVLKQLERSLKGLPLEEFVKHLLEAMGYRARLTERNTPSVDVVAHKDELGIEPPIIKVQVKSTLGRVDDKDVSALYGKVSQGEYGLLVTLGEFTPPAVQFANSKSNLRLIDGSALVQLIFEHYDAFDARYKGIIPLRRVYVPQPLEGEGEV